MWGDREEKKKKTDDLDISELKKRRLVSKRKLRNNRYFSIFENIIYNSRVEVNGREWK